MSFHFKIKSGLHMRQKCLNAEGTLQISDLCKAQAALGYVIFGCATEQCLCLRRLRSRPKFAHVKGHQRELWKGE